MAANRPSLWTRDFVLVGLSASVLLTSQTFLLASLPLLAVRRLGASTAQVGMLPGMVTVASLIARPTAGYAIDRLGRRWIQLIFLALVALFTFAYGLVTTLTALLAVRLTYGLFYGAANTATTTVVTDLIPPERRGEGIGYFGVAQTLGMAIGPAIALQVLAQGDFSRLFAVGGCLACAAVLLAVPIRHPPIRNSRARLSLGSLLEGRVWTIALVVFWVMFSYGSLTSFITLYAGQIGVAQAGLFFSAQSIGTVLARLRSGPLYDKYGSKWLVAGGLAALAMSYAGLALIRTPAGFFASAFVSGVGLSLAYPALQALNVALVDASRRGAANATFLSAQDLGLAVGAFVLGLAAQALGGYSTMYLAAAAAAVLAGILFLTVTLPRIASATRLGGSCGAATARDLKGPRL